MQPRHIVTLRPGAGAKPPWTLARSRGLCIWGYREWWGCEISGTWSLSPHVRDGVTLPTPCPCGTRATVGGNACETRCKSQPSATAAPGSRSEPRDDAPHGVGFRSENAGAGTFRVLLTETQRQEGPVDRGCAACPEARSGLPGSLTLEGRTAAG